jgi:glycosyltransferase involved in cell wall biosynthesis
VQIPVSVIIPSFNRSELLQRSLASVIAQTVTPSEIIVVDDGSTDSTAHLLETEFPQVTVLRQPNLGVSPARNAGIRKSVTKWIAFLDSDDVWMPDKLEKQWSALQQEPGYRICHTEEQWIYQGKEKPVAAPYRKRQGWIFEHCLPVCAISPSTVLIHKSALNEVGWFDETFPACEDYELWLRITSQMSVLLVNEALIEKHGGHGDQLSNQWGLDRWRIKALEKVLISSQLTEDQTQLVKEQLKKKCLIYASGLEKHGKVKEAEKYRTIIRLP